MEKDSLSGWWLAGSSKKIKRDVQHDGTRGIPELRKQGQKEQEFNASTSYIANPYSALAKEDPTSKNTN